MTNEIKNDESDIHRPSENIVVMDGMAYETRTTECRCGQLGIIVIPAESTPLNRNWWRCEKCTYHHDKYAMDAMLDAEAEMRDEDAS